MGDGRGEEAWNHTSSLLALMFNTNRDAKKEKARMPAHFNPYATKRDKLPGEVITDFGDLKHMFVQEEGKA